MASHSLLSPSSVCMECMGIHQINRPHEIIEADEYQGAILITGKGPPLCLDIACISRLHLTVELSICPCMMT